ncbi:uncharacterized protein LOC110826216 [Carica papaya]|uniref:uncharacterized protein LOC110826216 n=1 Tax=Carica papaya TaxID=3649 RepID=UPI000B8CAD9D|nr:uncharacterized protein LOC110826216 [Carica papaya]
MLVLADGDLAEQYLAWVVRNLVKLAGLSQKVISRPISDHFPICLVLEGIIWGPTPFTLDNKWLFVEGFRRWSKEEESRSEKALNENLKELGYLDGKEMEGSLGEQSRIRREEVRKGVVAVMNLEVVSSRQKAREKWLKEGDRNTRYFHYLANFHRKNNYVEKLCCNGELVRGKESMRRGAKQFFQHLYSEDEFRRPNLNNLYFRRLGDESRNGLEAAFTEEEIKGCLDECNGEKAPGLDGFNMKFYQVFLERD